MKRKSKAARTIKRTVTIAHPGGDLVSVQISATIRKPKNVRLTPELLSDMVKQKALDSAGKWDGKKVIHAHAGRDPSGVVLKIIRWRNPGRKRGKQNWRSGSQAAAWGSLRLALAKARFDFRPLGATQGGRK